MLFDVATATPRWAVRLPWLVDGDTWYTRIQFTPDGSGIIYGSPDDGIVLRDVQDGQVLRRIPTAQKLEHYTPALDPLGRGVWIVDSAGTPVLTRIEGFGFR